MYCCVLKSRRLALRRQVISDKMVQKTAKRSRGRPRSYEPEAALAGATDAFWDLGFSGSSLETLSRAMAMNRPSVYGAFGDKHALYMRTLARYRELSRSVMKEALADDVPFAQALRRVYGRAIDIYLSGERGARGCFLIGTAATESVHDRKIRASYAAGLHELDDQLEVRIANAVAKGELKGDIAPRVLARVAGGLMNALAVRARAGDSRADLEAIADAGVRLVCDR